ncbi:MAG: glycoside hydrolase family 97 N-terminal domain-containing protein, partial [Muribaculaceae bacterium]|nr:glycoside hydrolase family 97 N-terminal domain-containing protein [Muribaculaceae bacterium]
MKKVIISAILMASAAGYAMAAEQSSPSGALRLTVDLNGDGQPVYSLQYKGKPIIEESLLGLTADEMDFTGGFRITGCDTASVDQTWTPVWGEYAQVRDNYNELAVNLSGGTPERHMTLRFRVFDDGLGFRYELPLQDNANYLTLRDESTEFGFTADHTMWCIPGDYDTDEYLWAETSFSKLPEALAGYGRHSEAQRTGGTTIQTPLLLKSADPVYVN